MLRDAAYVLFTSEAEASNAADLVAPHQTFVTDLGTALDQPVEHAGIAELLRGFDRRKCVLYLGRLAHKKRPDLLLEAWAKVADRDDHRLVVAGPDGEFTRLDLERRAELLGIQDSVHLVGEVWGGQKAWLYERCGLFVLPSLNENFGMTIPEAMAGGCFILTTRDVAAHAHAMAAGSGAVIQELTADGVASSLSAVLGSDLLTSESSRRAKDYVRKHLSWDATAGNLRDHLAALQRGRGR
jgi:glycosyltransferase involved in cell wall biosynthesis